MSNNLYQRVREPREIYNQWDPTTDEVIDHLIIQRLRNHQNWIGAVCGETGSGKSYTALRIGEMVDPTFSSDNVVFSAKEFIDTFESRSPGELVVFDEGQEWSSRRSMSRKNVELTDIMAMLRFSLVSVIFTTPNIAMVDVSLRRLMHSFLNVEPIDRQAAPRRLRDKSFARIYVLKHTKRPGAKGSEIRPALPVVPVTRNGKTRELPINSALFTAPRADLLAAYERRKRDAFHVRLARARATLGGSTPPSAPPVPAQAAADLEGLM